MDALTGGHPSLEDAAHQVVEAIRQTRWPVADALFLVYGEDPLWEAISRRLRSQGISVAIRQRPLNSTPLSTLRTVLADRVGRFDLLLIQDRVAPGSTYEICTEVRGVVGQGACLVFIEFPMNSDPAASDLRPAYLRALAHPVAQLRRQMQTVRGGLAVGPLTITSGSGRLEMWVDAVHDDFTVLDVAPPIVQLPLGEVWMIVRDVAGVARLDRGSLDPLDAVAVDDELTVGGSRSGPVVEVGIGVNPAAIVIPTALCEKAAHRLHLGVGDDHLIGGDRKHPFHYDFLLTHDSTIGADL